MTWVQAILNKFVPSFEGKLLFVLAILLGGILGGWHIHTVWDAYWDTSSIKNQLAKAQAVPAKQSGFKQKLRDTHVQDTPCYNTRMPDAVIKLLK